MNLFRTVLSRFFLPLLLLLSATSVFSVEDDIETLKKALAEKLPTVVVAQINETPLPGIYEVIIGNQIVYLGKNARYMLNGDLINLATRKNHTEEAKSKIRITALDSLGEDKMLVYTPKQVDYTLTVVTDIDCPYCRRLHSEMNQYMANNIKVRYIFMPLKGQSDYDKTVSVWCAESKTVALDMAKSGAEIETLTCDNPIQEHLTLARQLGIGGTPAIILESGELLPGYIPVAKLLEGLNNKKVVAVN